MRNAGKSKVTIFYAYFPNLIKILCIIRVLGPNYLKFTSATSISSGRVSPVSGISILSLLYIYV